MTKILLVAMREFVATALTKGFIIGALVVPAIAAVAIPVVVILLNSAEAPAINGSLAVIDRSGEVVPALREEMAPERIAERMKLQREEIAREAAEQMGPLAGRTGDMDQQIARAQGGVPRIAIDDLGPDADPEAERVKVAGDSPDDGGRLGLLVIDRDVVEPPPGTPYAGFELITRPRLHDLTLADLRTAVRAAIFETRARLRGYDPAEIRAIYSVGGDTREITDTGEIRQSSEILNIMLPMGFLILIMMSVFVSGQYLLTTTVEEKSSRVIEILLSAVSPMQLMAGKIVGQMGVGLTLMTIYGSLGLIGLIWAARADLISPMTIAWMIVFYVIAYFLIASFMAAIGSAVNDMREAQAMMTPVVIVTIVPYLLAMPISRDPNSTLALVLSLVPPFSPFVMILRVASTQPPPLWQILAAAAIGALSVYVSIWACAKIFRVGLLMFGKPPNFKTLVHWIRIA